MNKFFNYVVLAALVSFSHSASAIWFEATGQAVINNGNKPLARQEATQEAIKQALLFSGASVTSVQRMAQGLLQDDRFEVRASGEVSNIELINETYNGDIVTVSIRADIFPQDTQCLAADYKKNIVTAWLPMSNRHQATIGNIFDIGKPMAGVIKESFNRYARYSHINHVEPFYFSPNMPDIERKAMDMARKKQAQFVLLNEIENLSVDIPEDKYVDYLTFWDNESAVRNIAIHTKLIDGATGELLMDNVFRGEAEWPFDRFETLDVNSGKLWRSNFGAGIKRVVQNIVQEVDERLSCLPAYGRIIQVSNNQLSANMGSAQGVKQGDQLKIFQMRQFFNVDGSPHYQYEIHPTTVQVARVFHDHAILRPVGAVPLANIQPNDFVVRQ
ncbi:flagella assembly protein FlgT [Alteromonas sp. a30]|uniref:flagella assembly protein FlgT n=1 Tax=Alteromonas sp. a30 TaxID=2730917 RepID=UPI002280ECD5|nr:flagella assembly protein FlgT [Alteromonas sp. a30]MCY7294559.1 hypothetical protein [Alteromonas sp. a30]